MNRVPILLLFTVYLLKKDELLQDFEIRTQKHKGVVMVMMVMIRMKGN